MLSTGWSADVYLLCYRIIVFSLLPFDRYSSMLLSQEQLKSAALTLSRRLPIIVYFYERRKQIYLFYIKNKLPARNK